MRILHEVRAREGVGLLPGYAEQSVLTNTCGAFKMLALSKDTHMWIKYDDVARERLTGLMRSAFMKPSDAKKIDSIMQSCLEHKLMIKLIKNMEYFFEKEKYTSDVRDCAANTILYPEYAILAPGIPHFRLLFATISGFLIVAVSVFVIEQAAKHC